MKLEKRLIYIIGIIVVLLIVIILVLWFIGMGKNNKILSYSEIETKMVEAAKNYAKNKPGILPVADDESYELSVQNLITAGYIPPISEYLGNNLTIQCTGNVKITYTAGINNYTPNLNCGSSYRTTFLYEKIIPNTVSEGHGLYQMADGKFLSGNYTAENVTYIYRGEYINNFIKFDRNTTVLWRIVEIDTNSNMVLVRYSPYDELYSWDNRYNVNEAKDTGYNDYSRSRVLITLNNLYDTKFGDDVKEKLIPLSLCTGDRKDDSLISDYNIECSEILDSEYIGLLTPSQFLMASLDEYCKRIVSVSCGNYNYLARSTKSWWLLTGNPIDTKTVYYVDKKSIKTTDANSQHSIRPIINLSNRAIFESGTGTEKDPYVIR